MTSVTIPLADGSLITHSLGEPAHFNRPRAPLTSRRAFAAAHVVADPLAENTPASGANVDWDATLAFRRHLWSWGLPVADAMDTAQRGMGLDWPATRELIVRSVTEARSEGGEIACGANTDQLPSGPATMDQIVDAYHEQIDLIEGHGGQAVVMASRHLAALAGTPVQARSTHVEVYGSHGIRRSHSFIKTKPLAFNLFYKIVIAYKISSCCQSLFFFLTLCEYKYFNLSSKTIG